jgi:hypothetical protein
VNEAPSMRIQSAALPIEADVTRPALMAGTYSDPWRTKTTREDR